MSGYANINAFSDPNVLLQTLSGAQTQDVQAKQIANQYAPARNQLLLDEGQQQLGSNEIGMMARAAQGLLDPTAYPDEASRAAAYPGVVADLQRNGFAKNAPTTYPGEATLRQVAGMGMTVPEQYQYGLVVPPGLQRALTGSNPPPAATGAGGGGPDPVAAMPREQALDAIAQRESSNQNVPNAQGGDASGYWQIRNATWQDGGKLAGIDVSRWPRAMDAPWMVQRQVAGALFDKYGAVPWAASAPGRSTQVAATGQPAAPPPAATRGPPAAGAPGVARPELGTPGGGQPTPGMTDEQWLAAASKSYPSLGGPNDTSQQPNAGSPAPSTQATRLGGTATAGPGALPPPGAPGASTAALPAPPAASLNAVAPGAPGAPPMPQPPAAPAAPQAQPQAALPHAADVPTGVNAPQYKQAMAIQQQIAALTPYAALPAAKARIAQLQQQAQTLLQTDSVVQTQEGQKHTLTGVIDKPVPHYVVDPNTGGLVDATGSTLPPTPRVGKDAQGNTFMVLPGGGIQPISPANYDAIVKLHAAETQGSALGTATGKLPEQLADQGREATQAITNIDYGLAQIQKAKEGGIPTGYFAPWLGTLAAIGKSIGGDTGARIAGLGADPSAVGNIQTAQKTLAVVSSAILQQMLGEGQITDAKIAHYIHAQPGIETDPDALNRVLNWARTQFVYEREMSAQGMKDASVTGALPTNWRAKYFDQHGFAPIYNPATGEVQQPDGQAPSREPPATTTFPTAPVNPSARTAGNTYTTPQGPLKWTGTGWLPPSATNSPRASPSVVPGANQ